MEDDYALPQIDTSLKGYSSEDLLKELFSRYDVVTFCALRYDEIKDRDFPYIVEQGNHFTLLGLYEVARKRAFWAGEDESEEEAEE